MLNPTLKFFFAKCALLGLRGLRQFAYLLQAILRSLATFALPLGRFMIVGFALPLYRVIVIFKLRMRRVALSARGIVFFLLTNRYLLHAILGLLAMTTIGVNLKGQRVSAQDVSQKTILFTLAAKDTVEIVEEEVRPEARQQPPERLNAVRIQSIPNVDFDYDDDRETPKPFILVPGTIQIQPYEEDAVIEKARPSRTKIETYVVQTNDTVSSIAKRFGVNIGAILWNNHLTERAYIQPGDTLTIPPVSGLIVKVKSGETVSKIAKRFHVSEEEIQQTNLLTPQSPLAVGTELVIPGAQPPEIEQQRTQLVARSRPSSAEPSFGAARKPQPFDARALPPTRLLWPTASRTITQYYGWRHTGIDIDGDYASPLYAAYDGIVETAGWNASGYGLMILIDHRNGIQTRYAHASKLFVKDGDKVERGQVIGMVGTTGRSTGTHLHFEVYAHGRRTNPFAYIR